MLVAELAPLVTDEDPLESLEPLESLVESLESLESLEPLEPLEPEEPVEPDESLDPDDPDPLPDDPLVLSASDFETVLRTAIAVTRVALAPATPR